MSCKEGVRCYCQRAYLQCACLPLSRVAPRVHHCHQYNYGRRRLATCTCGSLKTLLDGRRGAEIVRKVNVPVREFYSCSGLVSLVYNPVVGKTCISGLSKLFVEKLASLCLGGKRVLSP